MVSTHALEELLDTNVGAYDGVQDPFQAEVCDAVGVFFEGIQAADFDGAGGCKALAREKSGVRG